MDPGGGNSTFQKKIGSVFDYKENPDPVQTIEEHLDRNLIYSEQQRKYGGLPHGSPPPPPSNKKARDFLNRVNDRKLWKGTFDKRDKRETISSFFSVRGGLQIGYQIAADSDSYSYANIRIFHIMI